jgi:hypothetical protein
MKGVRMTTTDQRVIDLVDHELASTGDGPTFLDQCHSSLKVLLVGNYAPDDQASMRAFLRALERDLPKHGCELRVVAPPQRLQRFGRGPRARKWLGYIDKFILFIPGLAAQSRWADVVHICDHSNSMYARWVRSRPTVITCHDVISVQATRGMVDGWTVGWTGRIFQRLISLGLAKADLIACVSHTTARELAELQLVDERRVTIVLNGLNDSFFCVQPWKAQRLIERFGVGAQDAYLLHVGLDLPKEPPRCRRDVRRAPTACG